MTDRIVVATADAPDALGPYSQGIVHGDVLYCSGTLPLDPATGELVSSSPRAETRRCLENLAAVCRAAGTELGRALRLTMFVADLAAFGEINDAYAEFFPADPPARVTIEVAALPKGAGLEIDAIVAFG